MDTLSTKVSRKVMINKKHYNTLKELSTTLVLRKPEQDIIRKRRNTDLSAYTNSSHK